MITMSKVRKETLTVFTSPGSESATGGKFGQKEMGELASGHVWKGRGGHFSNK